MYTVFVHSYVLQDILQNSARGLIELAKKVKGKKTLIVAHHDYQDKSLSTRDLVRDKVKVHSVWNHVSKAM